MSARGRAATIVDFIDRAYLVLGEIDYYQILGVARDAAPTAIRDAYYRLSAKLHPDVHGDDVAPDLKQRITSVYSRLVEAYRVLSDPAQRTTYDEGLTVGEHRLNTGVRLKIKPEDTIRDPGARRFYGLGMQALGGQDVRSAVMNLRMALQRETSAVISEALARAEALLKEPRR